MKKTGKWRMVLCLLAVCVAALYGVLKIVAYKWVFETSHRMRAAPGKLKRPFEDVYIPVENEERIEAWYFPARDASSPVILLCHGHAGTMSDCLVPVGLLLDCGAGVVVFDYRGYGRSDGSPSEENTYRDAQAVYHWLAAKGIPPARIVPYGHSLGGGVATELTLREKTGGLILQSAFTSLPDVGEEHVPLLSRLILNIHYDNLAKLPRVRVPVLILHSRTDGMVPFHEAEGNFAAANEPKYFQEIRGGHANGPTASRAEMLKAIREFLRKIAIITNDAGAPAVH